LSEFEHTANGVVTTIAAKCRRCYNCVRSCPAKAIRVQDGQAQVIAERCIGCGNCVKVCAQGAKQVQPADVAVFEMLGGTPPTVAIVAPSYPAAFENLSAEQVIGGIRALGFDRVLEVGFGAEMVATAYADLLKDPPDHPVITTPCPALVSYIVKHMPELAYCLAPIVSPMVALGRAIKQDILPGAGVVFIGPCIAKKAELDEPSLIGAIDAALTFRELAELWEARGIDPTGLSGEADGPLPHFGALFPVSGGLLKAAAVEADIMDDSIAVIEGPDRCLSALQALARDELSTRFLDMLFCEGCIAGPGFGEPMSPLARKALVTRHVRNLEATAPPVPPELARVEGVDLTRTFETPRIRLDVPTETEIRDVLARTNKYGEDDELNCGACGYPTCREKAIAVCQGLAEPEMCLPYLIDQLEVNLEKLNSSKEEIERAREVATRAQQLASMGELASDIAEEISNPLAKIAAFAQLLLDQLPEDDTRREDLAAVIAEASQCRHVVAGLRSFARQREPQWEQTDSNEVVRRAAEMARDEVRASNVDLAVRLGDGLPLITADPAQLAAVVVNVVTNAFEATAPGGEVIVETRNHPSGQMIEIEVSDNGRGIPEDLLPKVFQPFVTTKRNQTGAGLGLAVAHGIVHAHGGDIDIRSGVATGTAVTISLPAETPPSVAREAMKILCVDDDPDFLEQHRIILESTGFDVITAERSDEAIEIANREIPDAFVLDLMMERNDSGARLARALRRDPRFRAAPIIMLTSVVHDLGFEFQRNPQEVLEWMKADAWFDKPAPPAELAATLQRLLAGLNRDRGEKSTAGE